MHITGHAIEVLTPVEIDLIHQGALRILHEMGMEIQNQRLLQVCAASGLSVDFDRQRVRFPAPQVERFLSEVDKFDWENVHPSVTASAGIYHGLYHDPNSGQLIPWSETNLAYYIALARALPHIGSASMLGCRLPVPPSLEPLYERFYCWKYGASEGSSIYLDEICPYLLDLYQVWAAYQQKPLAEVFRGTVYLVPALRLGRHEAYQVAYFWERGLRVGIGDMHAMGANAPVTVAGAVTLNLAERIALAMLNQVLYGDRTFHLDISVAPMDMRTLIYPFGRPEQAVVNVVTAQLARHYGVPFSGHAALTSAKLPSVEVGYQKALAALPTLLAGGSLWMDAGLLSTDEVYSPIQMVLDNEFLSALKHMVAEYEVTPETLGIDTILEAGPGGNYLDKDHTLSHFRGELWQPALWTRQMLRPWLDSGAHLDVDLARDYVLEVQSQPITPFIPDSLQTDLLKVIKQAETHFLSHS
jgi:trimethylamine--corrinoid protein Co-methyltransferase